LRLFGQDLLEPGDRVVDARSEPWTAARARLDRA
jgi:hypothetical protein